MLDYVFAISGLNSSFVSFRRLPINEKNARKALFDKSIDQSSKRLS